MLGGILDSGALQAARAALDGLSRRQEAISANVANIDTVGYQRRSVDFEDQLARAVGWPGPDLPEAQLSRTHAAHLGSAGGAAISGEQPNPGRAVRDVVSSRNDQNEVSIDEELVLLAETQVRFQALSQSVGKRLATLRSVIRG